MTSRWGFIIAALFGLVGIVIAWYLPEGREETPLEPLKKTQHETEIRVDTSDYEIGQESEAFVDNARLFLRMPPCDNN